MAKKKKAVASPLAEAALEEFTAEQEPLSKEDTAALVAKGVTPLTSVGRRARKQVRYQLYRLRTDALGKASADSTQEFRESFESQPLFKGWRFFAETWDVALDDPMRVVARLHTEQEEWDAVVAAKFPQVSVDGKVSYPNPNVRRRVEAEAEERRRLAKIERLKAKAEAGAAQADNVPTPDDG